MDIINAEFIELDWIAVDYVNGFGAAEYKCFPSLTEMFSFFGVSFGDKVYNMLVQGNNDEEEF